MDTTSDPARPHRPALDAAAAAAPHEIAEDVRRLVGALGRGRWLIALAVAACLTIAVLFLAANPRVYQARTRLVVLQQGGRPLNIASNAPAGQADGSEDPIPTQAIIVRSPVVVARALERVGRAALPSLAHAEDPTQEAIARLAISRPDRSAKVLQLDYQAGSRAEAVRVVAAIAASYEEFLEASSRRGNGDVIALITHAREGLRAELDLLEEKYLAYRDRHPGLTLGEGGRSFAARRLEQADREATEATAKAVRLKAQLELGRDLAGRGAGLWAIAHALNQIAGEPGGGLLPTAAAPGPQADQLRQLVQERQQVAERFGPGYAKARDLQEQIDRLQGPGRDALGRPDRAEADDLLAAIERSLATLERLRDGYVRQFEADLAGARTDELNRLAEANLKAALERHRALFHTVVDQLKQAQLVGDYGGIGVQTIEPPNALRNPVKPKVGLTLALATLIGGMLGVGAAVVADQLDLRIRTPEELRRSTEVAVLGLIPRLPQDQTAASGAVGRISHALPRSPLAEAYRMARTSLEEVRRGRRVQVVLVASARPGDGKTTTASNLAISMAQAGRKVLLIDADLRNPGQERLHNLRADRGLVHLLREGLAAELPVQASATPGLDLLVAGTVPGNPAELLMAPHLEEVLAAARRAYDLVLIDSSPLLEVTDAAILGSHVDGVLLVARMGTTRQVDSRRAVAILKGIGTPILGGVLTRIARDWTSQGYSGYGSPPDRPRAPGPRERAARAKAEANGVQT